jgi:hypothetical protein
MQSVPLIFDLNPEDPSKRDYLGSPSHPADFSLGTALNDLKNA